MRVRGAQMDAHRAEAAAARRALQEDLDASRVCSSRPLCGASPLRAVAPLNDPSHALHGVCLRCSVARSQWQPRACLNTAAPGAPAARVRPLRRGVRQAALREEGAARARAVRSLRDSAAGLRVARDAEARLRADLASAGQQLAASRAAQVPLHRARPQSSRLRPAFLRYGRLSAHRPSCSRARFCTRPGLSALTPVRAKA
jgi:hypothetical protein